MARLTLKIRLPMVAPSALFIMSIRGCMISSSSVEPRRPSARQPCEHGDAGPAVAVTPAQLDVGHRRRLSQNGRGRHLVYGTVEDERTERRMGQRAVSGTDSPDPATEVYAAHRNLLFTVAY